MKWIKIMFIPISDSDSNFWMPRMGETSLAFVVFG